MEYPSSDLVNIHRIRVDWGSFYSVFVLSVVTFSWM